MIPKSCLEVRTSVVLGREPFPLWGGNGLGAYIAAVSPSGRGELTRVTSGRGMPNRSLPGHRAFESRSLISKVVS